MRLETSGREHWALKIREDRRPSKCGVEGNFSDKKKLRKLRLCCPIGNTRENHGLKAGDGKERRAKQVSERAR
jgi:hypothetical protein